MKKLMFTLATAAMVGGAYAGVVCADAEVRTTDSAVCDDAKIEVETEDCRVYDLAMTLKTLAPKKLTCKACKYDCSDDVIVSYLDNATLKLNGYVWTCAEECVETYEGAFVALWNKSTKSPVIPLGYHLNGAVASQDPMVFDVFELVRYGKKATSVAAYWELDTPANYDIACPLVLVGAGVNGSSEKYTEFCNDTDWDENAYGILLKSISGNVAGHFGVSQLWKKVCAGTITYDIQKVLMCDCWSTWCDDLDTFEDGDLVPATGTWSLKYNKKLSKANKSMLTLVPSYALMEF